MQAIPGEIDGQRWEGTAMVYRVFVDPKPNCETVMIEKDGKIYIGRYNIQDGVLYLWARGPWGFRGVTTLTSSR